MISLIIVQNIVISFYNIKICDFYFVSTLGADLFLL